MDHRDLIAKVVGALDRESISLNFLNFGASETSLLLGVHADKTHDAVIALYNALF
jgi:aspartate kinase